MKPKNRISRLTDDELARRAEIARKDRAEAAAAWKRHAPARFKNILDARTFRRGSPRGR